MPKPNCTEVDVGPLDFGRLGRRVVEGRFDGGSMTGDGGVMLLAQVDRKLGLMGAAARCIADPRSPLLIKHGVRDMLRQRVYGLTLGWEDLNGKRAASFTATTTATAIFLYPGSLSDLKKIGCKFAWPVAISPLF